MKILENAGFLSIVIIGGLILSSIFGLTAGAIPSDFDRSPFKSPLHSPVPKPVTTNEKLPLDIQVWNPCAEEWVHLTGRLHTVFHISYDALGGYHAQSHSQPQGVRGYGQESGVKYRGTGVTQQGFNGKVGSQETFVNNFRIIGQGKGNNLVVHEAFHVTINANGRVTAFVDNFRVECK